MKRIISDYEKEDIMKKFIISIFILMSISVTASANMLNCNIYDNQGTSIK